MLHGRLHTDLPVLGIGVWEETAVRVEMCGRFTFVNTHQAFL